MRMGVGVCVEIWCEDGRKPFLVGFTNAIRKKYREGVCVCVRARDQGTLKTVCVCHRDEEGERSKNWFFGSLADGRERDF